MGNCYNYTPIPPAEASCIIAHLFVELALPCSCCKREDGVIVIQGKTYDGSSARVTIKGEEVRYYGKQRTLATKRVGLRRRLGTEGRFFKVLLHPAPFLLLRDGPAGPEVAEGSRADRLR